MDPEELSAAIDRLNEERAPEGEEDDLLRLARVLRGLREPAWPEDQEAFLRSLLPRRRPERELSAVAALVLAALLSTFPIGSGGGPQRVPALVLQTPAKTSALASAAPFQPALHEAAAANLARAGAPRARLELVELLPGPAPEVVVTLRLPAGGQVPRRGILQDLAGRGGEVRLRASRVASRTWRLFLAAPDRPGWYRLRLTALDLALAFFVPYPRDSLEQGEVSLPLPGVAGGAVHLFVRYTVSGTEVRLPEAWSAVAGGVTLSVPGRGREHPVLKRQGRGSVTFVFDPTPEGVPSRLSLLLPSGRRLSLLLPKASRHG